MNLYYDFHLKKNANYKFVKWNDRYINDKLQPDIDRIDEKLENLENDINDLVQNFQGAHEKDNFND